MKNKTWITSAHRGFVKENMAANTLSAYRLAAQKGADMIETDARMCSDGVLIVNHDPDVKGFNEKGEPVSYIVSETDSKTLTSVILAPNDPFGVQYVPTLQQVLDLAYFTGLRINIDLKDGIKYADKVAEMVVASGMRGRTVYAPNGAGAEAIKLICSIDPEAKFIDTVENFTRENLISIPGYQSKCFAYTSDFSDENIERVRKSGCMLATISISEKTAEAAFSRHPDMAEYLHTSDFEAIDKMILSKD